MEFNPPTVDEGGLGDEETTPLESEAGTPDDEGNEAAADGDIDDDKEPHVQFPRVFVYSL